MPRIPDTELERLKNEVSVERLVEASGVALKKAGTDLLGRCPFHDDTEASLVVTAAKNLWHCFGCQVGGGPIDWVMKSRGVSFRHAVELLKADPALAAGQAGEVKRTTVRSLPTPVAFDADDRAVLLVDEAQEMSPAALCELRLMASARFDSQPLLCVVLAGDARLIDKLRREELIPLGSRIRTRLATEHTSR